MPANNDYVDQAVVGHWVLPFSNIGALVRSAGYCADLTTYGAPYVKKNTDISQISLIYIIYISVFAEYFYVWHPIGKWFPGSLYKQCYSAWSTVPTLSSPHLL